MSKIRVILEDKSKGQTHMNHIISKPVIKQMPRKKLSETFKVLTANKKEKICEIA
jgi:hypothetical protein